MDKEIRKHVHEVECPAVGVEQILVTVPCLVRGFADVGHVDMCCCGPAVGCSTGSATASVSMIVSLYNVLPLL